MLLPFIMLSTFLTVALTLVAVVIILAILFYVMYHTYHGDLPGIMKLVIIGFIFAIGLFVVMHFIF